MAYDFTVAWQFSQKEQLVGKHIFFVQRFLGILN
jgi:hypothetical protein